MPANTTQVSRLGMPLVNEVVIGLPDKDRFNGSKPKDDAQFAGYVTHPSLPALLEIALGLPGIAPTNFPRTDLVTAFLTGIKGRAQRVCRRAYRAGANATGRCRPVAFSLQAGAEFVVMICGDVMTLPGLPKVPSSHAIDVCDDGRITGLF